MKGKLLSIGKKLLITKISIVSLVAATYAGYKNSETISRFERNILHNNLSIESGYFKDPEGLTLDYQINDNGNQEIYILHNPSQKRLQVLEDMLPSNNTILDGLKERIDSMDTYQAKEFLKKIDNIERKIYGRL